MFSIHRRSAVWLAVLLFASAAGAGNRCAYAQSSASSTPSSDDDLINADRPGIADGSRVIDPGRIQLEIGAQHERRADDGTRTETLFAPTLVRLGLTSRLELRVESNTLTSERATSDDGSSARNTGLAPVLLGFKWALYDSGGDARRSLGTIVRIAPPSGSSEFGTSRVTGDVRLAADWDFAPQLSLNPNVGAAHLDDGDGGTFDTALGAVTLTWAPTDHLNPFVDLGYQSLEAPGGTWALAVDAGLAYIVGRDVQLDVSAGTRAHGTTPARPFVAIGVSARATAFHAAK